MDRASWVGRLSKGGLQGIETAGLLEDAASASFPPLGIIDNDPLSMQASGGAARAIPPRHLLLPDTASLPDRVGDYQRSWRGCNPTQRC